MLSKYTIDSASHSMNIHISYKELAPESFSKKVFGRDVVIYQAFFDTGKRATHFEICRDLNERQIYIHEFDDDLNKSSSTKNELEADLSSYSSVSGKTSILKKEVLTYGVIKDVLWTQHKVNNILNELHDSYALGLYINKKWVSGVIDLHENVGEIINQFIHVVDVFISNHMIYAMVNYMEGDGKIWVSNISHLALRVFDRDIGQHFEYNYRLK
ncbi:hypothetical protein RF11_05982 [Thelohanellus kitauei]|uniref:Uncharacterized protein n=1 Tax=Thelohanellus kitauei TaxID=669202 RepID=A0A0C2MKU6_THEKT|nr:hypothetical protein RF11_05982 [Thelohanellus kitauei]